MPDDTGESGCGDAGCGWTVDGAITDAGFTLQGRRTDDYAGWFTDVSDVTGDGGPDLIVAAPRADDNGDRSGVVYVVHSPITAGGALSTLAAATLIGEPGTELGWVAKAVGDLDGDGVADLALGEGGNPSNVYLLAGATTGEHVISDVGNVWVPEDRTPPETATDPGGGDVDGVGDVTGDGVPDVLVGAPSHSDEVAYGGAAYVVDGAVALEGGDLADAAARIYGLVDYAYLGTAASGLGDVNGDGVADIAVGAAEGYHPNTTARVGAIFVYFGPTLGMYTEDDADVSLHPGENGDKLHYPGSLYGPGDVTGDGVPDVLVGSPNEYGRGGVTYLYSGAALSGQVFLDDSEARIEARPGMESGRSLVSVGDLDGDERLELAIGAPGDDELGYDTGAVYVVHGDVLSGTVFLEEAYAARFHGGDKLWLLGYGVSAGDLTGDGLVDLVAGGIDAPGEQDDAGAVFVIPGL